MIRFWTADTHYNHANIAKYCNRPQVKDGDLNPDGSWVSPEIAFQRAEQMNTMLMRESNQRVKPGDQVICVGDFACRGGERGVQGLHIKPAELLAQLHGTWTLVYGNHDENNGVKETCDFLSLRMGKYEVGVQHRPLYDDAAYQKWLSGSAEDRNANPWREKMSPKMREKQADHARYCADHFDFMICGHVHNAWKVKKIAGIWHVNVGVDVCRYMPISDVEVMQVYEKAIKGA